MYLMNLIGIREKPFDAEVSHYLLSSVLKVLFTSH